MLVLSRNMEESIIIGPINEKGDIVKITVIGLPPGKVRLGVEAPREVPVHRKEIYESIHAADGEQNAEKQS